MSVYRGRFAPSPTGALHAGSLVAALASWLDARAHQGQWRVRIEDVDTPRCVPGADHLILNQLAQCGLHPDGAVVWQSQRSALYQTALQRLQTAGWAYACGCSRQDIAAAQTSPTTRHSSPVYTGTCRDGLRGRPARAWRLHVPRVQQALQLPENSTWTDRRLGLQQQRVAQAVGDFVLHRADGLWAYQLAVVVDDAEQGISHVVRGEDLSDNTPRQHLLQTALGLPHPQYLHTPLVRNAQGEKLSKQNGAAPLDLSDPLQTLHQTAQALGLPPASTAHTVAQALAFWVAAWPELLRAWAQALGPR